MGVKGFPGLGFQGSVVSDSRRVEGLAFGKTNPKADPCKELQKRDHAPEPQKLGLGFQVWGLGLR